MLNRSHEALNESQCGVRDLAPAAVDDERVASAWHFGELGDAGVGGLERRERPEAFARLT